MTISTNKIQRYERLFDIDSADNRRTRETNTLAQAGDNPVPGSLIVTSKNRNISRRDVMELHQEAIPWIHPFGRIPSRTMNLKQKLRMKHHTQEKSPYRENINEITVNSVLQFKINFSRK